jgi:type III pantothenate kinase
MSLLLIDIGNTRVKWAELKSDRLRPQRAMPHAGWGIKDFEQNVFKAAHKIERVIVVSVASQNLEHALSTAALRCCRVGAEFVKTERNAGGVTTRYEEPWRLGVDRFVACIGAHHLIPRQPVCVVDIGTAMTIDLVDADGVHRGGAIIPGPDLMIGSLLKDTVGIQRRASGAAPGKAIFARNTRAAIEQGARYAVAAAIDRAAQEARKVLKKQPVLILTGGAATRVRSLVSMPHRLVPDLVLRGLAAMT